MTRPQATTQNTITLTNTVQFQGGSRLVSEKPFHFFYICYGPDFSHTPVQIANKNVVQLTSSSLPVFFTAWQMRQDSPPIRVAKWIGNASELTSGQDIDVTVR